MEIKVLSPQNENRRKCIQRVEEPDQPEACRAFACAACRGLWQMKTVPRSPSRDVGVPHSESCNPAGMTCTAVFPMEFQRPPAKEAGKDWDRMRDGP